MLLSHPDYVGLGVDRDVAGKPVLHQYLSNPRATNDIFFAVQAAQAAFASLSKQFVVMGHSQGGGAAWAAAQRQAVNPVPGYLGAIAGSPLTDFLDTLVAAEFYGGGVAAHIAYGLSSIFPMFELKEFLTEAGIKRLALATEIQACYSVVGELMTDETLYQPRWWQSFYARAFQKLTPNGGKPIAGPMLVLQGEADPVIPASATTAGVNITCAMYPESDIEYLTFAGVGHVPVMYASQQNWLGWIEDRFAGRSTACRCGVSRFASTLATENYQADLDWVLKFAAAPYETA